MLDVLEHLGCEINHTGSTYICDPAPTDTDIDYLVYVKNREVLSEIIGVLEGGKWDIDKGEHYQVTAGNTFISFSKDKINLLLSNNKDFCKRHKIATAVCKKLNLLKKEDRVMVFQAILYNNAPKFEV